MKLEFIDDNVSQVKYKCIKIYLKWDYFQANLKIFSVNLSLTMMQSTQGQLLVCEFDSLVNASLIA